VRNPGNPAAGKHKTKIEPGDKMTTKLKREYLKFRNAGMDPSQALRAGKTEIAWAEMEYAEALLVERG
jgi:hypothetical protein